MDRFTKHQYETFRSFNIYLNRLISKQLHSDWKQIDQTLKEQKKKEQRFFKIFINFEFVNVFFGNRFFFLKVLSITKFWRKKSVIRRIGVPVSRLLISIYINTEVTIPIHLSILFCYNESCYKSLFKNKQQNTSGDLPWPTGEFFIISFIMLVDFTFKTASSSSWQLSMSSTTFRPFLRGRDLDGCDSSLISLWI